MATKREDAEELVRAAATLEEELHNLESLAGSVAKAPLKTRKHIERAAKQLEEIADSDERLNAAVTNLVGAVQRARARREAQTEVINAAAHRLQERTEAWRALMERFAGLGTEAAALHASATELAAAPASEPALALVGRMEELAQQAGQLATEATEAEFDDVFQQADAIRQQLLSTRNKIKLVSQQDVPQA